MGAELLAPFAKWGAALLGVCLVGWFAVRMIGKRATAEQERDQALEVGDALRRFQEAERQARDLPRDELLARLRDRAGRRRS